jgi:hypothetical protein
MPLKQVFGLRRTRGILIDQIIITDPIGQSITSHETTTFETAYTKTIPKATIKAGDIKYIILTLKYGLSMHTHVAFFSGDTQMSDTVSADGTARFYSYTYTITNQNADLVMNFKGKDDTNGATTQSVTTSDVEITAGRLAMKI